MRNWYQLKRKKLLFQPNIRRENTSRKSIAFVDKYFKKTWETTFLNAIKYKSGMQAKLSSS